MYRAWRSHVIILKESTQSQDRQSTDGLQDEQLVPESCPFDQRRAERGATIWMRMAVLIAPCDAPRAVGSRGGGP
jgi:hypothetical protein